MGAVALSLVLLAAGCGTARASAKEADLIAEVLALRAGMQVADVGAGNGRWSEELARRVGEAGHVWATEVDEEEIEEIRDRLEEAELRNVTPVLGGQQDTGLPEACCDAVLLRLVYHHFTEPEPMRVSLRRALRPGGLIAVIDIVPQEHWRQLPGVPDRGGHGIAPADLIAEMTSDGFEVVAEYQDWDGEEDRFCVVFRR
ncbi:MAG: class I SAM-dependent methyltransferase [bacterium]|nr:class I SAM-dependent methyltransferase [bacterium]